MIGGGGAQSAPPIFICENHRKDYALCWEKKNLGASFEGMAIFHGIQLSYDRGGPGGALSALY